MRRLILLRHGKAEASSAGGDAERGLTERGRGDAALVAHALAEAGVAPDLALVSPARRTRETWGAAAASFPAARMETSPQLYLASAAELARQADAAGEAGTLMIIGHNPGLHEFAQALLAGRDARGFHALADGFPTSAAAVIRLQPDGCVLERFITARQLKVGAA